MQGGKLLRESAGLLAARGKLGPFDAVVVARRPPQGLSDEERTGERKRSRTA